GDTDTTPRDSGVRASRVTYVAGNAVMQACGKLREQLFRHAARRLECGADEIEFDGGKFWLRQDPGQQITLRRVVTQASELKTVLVKSGGGVGPLDSKPIGEFANNGPPAAIANAVADAVGVRLFELPITAEKIYRSLKERKPAKRKEK